VPTRSSLSTTSPSPPPAMSQPTALTARSPLAVVYLLHIALDLPVAIQGLWLPQNLPFLEMNNTALVLLKVRSVASMRGRVLTACVRSCTRRSFSARASRRSYASRSLVRRPTSRPSSRSTKCRTDFLPGKRAFSICLCLYHTISSTILIQSPRFIPITFGALFESCVGRAAAADHALTRLAQVEAHARGRVGLPPRPARRPLRVVVAGPRSCARGNRCQR
jgi:hypothetical protein